jgi:NitT/TauT family transport system substrate-binding protein
MRAGFFPLICILILLIMSFFSILPVQKEFNQIGNNPSVTFVYASSGIMPQLLNTSQVDGFFVWESVVSTADLGEIGKVIARDADIPPDHKWNNTACNVLVMRNDFISKYPEIAALLSAVTIAGMKRISTDPNQAKNITANWVYGSKPIQSAALYLNPYDVENEAFKYITFTDSASLPDISSLSKPVDDIEKTKENQPSFVNESVLIRAKELLNGTEPEISGRPPTVTIGYLPSADLYAPLYVTIMDHGTICDTYGFCLAPEPGLSGRPTKCELIFYNKTIAYITLLPGQVGGGVMTGLGQDAMDGAYIGSVPVLLQISMENNASIIQSINAGGSGLVVNEKAPCNDWNSFISWIKKRYSDGRPVILAVPQSSIQEEMMRQAFVYEGINITLYGLPSRYVS